MLAISVSPLGIHDFVTEMLPLGVLVRFVALAPRLDLLALTHGETVQSGCSMVLLLPLINPRD